jgi:DNA replication protein DnaC
MEKIEENDKRALKMGRMFEPSDIDERSQTCVNCGNKYDARWVKFGGVFKDTSSGECLDCRKISRTKYEANREAQEKAERIAALLSKKPEYVKTCGIPPLFQNKGFTEFDKKRGGNVGKVCDACQEYAELFPMNGNPQYQSLLLYGGNGLGKSHLAAAIGLRILERWQGEPSFCMVKFISEPELINSIQATFNYSNEEQLYRESADLIVSKCINTPLLILDDVAKEQRQNMEFVRRTLFHVIDGRYKRGKPIVLTTNKTDLQLKQYLSPNTDDEASFSRLWEMARGEFWKLSGNDYRKTERN